SILIALASCVDGQVGINQTELAAEEPCNDCLDPVDVSDDGPDTNSPEDHSLVECPSPDPAPDPSASKSWTCIGYCYIALLGGHEGEDVGINQVQNSLMTWTVTPIYSNIVGYWKVRRVGISADKTTAYTDSLQ